MASEKFRKKSSKINENSCRVKVEKKTPDRTVIIKEEPRSVVKQEPHDEDADEDEDEEEDDHEQVYRIP